MIDRMNHRLAAIAVGLWLSVVITAVPAAAQRSPLPAPDEEPAEAEETSELSEIESKTNELRSRLQEWQAKAAEYERAGQEASARTELIDQEIEHLKERKAITVAEDSSSAELDARLLEAEQDLAAARREATELDTKAELRAERRRRVPELLSVAKQRLKELESAPPRHGGRACRAELA
jgi:chromosome segregation ATPase